MAEFRMPSLGADMEAGTLVEWNVQTGDRLKRGDIIALVETDKGLIEVEVFEDGVVENILVQPGTRVPVGTALAFIRAEGAAPLPTAAATEPTPAVAESKPPPAAVPSPPLPVTPPGERVIASP